MNIQENGFDVSLSGTNAGAALGRGLYVTSTYVTSTLEKALNYAKHMPYNGAIFELRVDLGRCYTVNANDSNRQNWNMTLHGLPKASLENARKTASKTLALPGL
jgi:hypothetical protein